MNGTEPTSLHSPPAGRDLIGVQNLMKKHQAVLAEVSNHENRVDAVSQAGRQMVADGHFAAAEVRQRVDLLDDHWAQLKEKARQRKHDLDDSLQAHQYFADANEAESWMKEKEPIVCNVDYGERRDLLGIAPS
jgi:spectrin alpha